MNEVILAGGLGTRISEETHRPMIEIGVGTRVWQFVVVLPGAKIHP